MYPAFHASCFSMLLGRRILSSKRACLPGLITVRGPELRHSFNKNERVCMHVTPKSLKKWPHTVRYICVNCAYFRRELTLQGVLNVLQEQTSVEMSM